ncbi:Cell cycle protein GpsB [bioreactor metagenome]|uniref:Cell cycle protein GpsB n=1 Tax=bioreactor metagenome TaxID=1076179 RepID=A0A645B202_9ZZZZ|nr:DivIVA domain-containing protein [Erysipelotrichaceae bacterium]
MNEEFNLKPQKIFDKQFSIEFKGYAAEEVDQYLDLIIQDYQKMDNIYQTLQEKIAVLQQNNATLKTYIIELEAKLKSLEDATPANATDILKRLSRLEAKIANDSKEEN